MAWIKRNLFFAIGGLIALLLLGAASYYGFKSWRDNSSKMAQLQEAYNDLQNYLNKVPSPSDENIAAAKDNQAQLRKWINDAGEHFKPVPPIPNPPDGNVTTEQFAGSLRKTIQDLQLEATNANVGLPQDYSFSFAAERNLVTFAPNSLNPLASHLGEIKAICEILFDAKINAIDGIQREMISDNDATGPQSDYLAEKSQTSDLATITPYSITFRCFSADLGQVIAKMAASDYAFVIKGINVMPAAGAQMGMGGMGENPMAMPNPGYPAPPGYPPRYYNAPPPVQQQPENAGLQTALDEQLLQVTMAIEVVKLSAK
jgi:hypothetical protein